MDRTVDQAGGPAAARDPAVTEEIAQVDETAPVEESSPADDVDVQDIESELYSSTREAGIVAVAFTPIADS